MSLSWTINTTFDGALYGVQGSRVESETEQTTVSFTRDPEFATPEEARTWGVRYIAQWERSEAQQPPAPEPSSPVTQTEIDQAIQDIIQEEQAISNGMGGG